MLTEPLEEVVNPNEPKMNTLNREAVLHGSITNPTRALQNGSEKVLTRALWHGNLSSKGCP